MMSFLAGEVKADDQLPVNQVKAGHLVLFVRYVEWPKEKEGALDDRPFVVAVLGHDPFGDVLEQAFAGLLPNGRPVKVRRIGSSAEAKNCDMVFISREEERRQAGWLAELAGSAVLTVSDADTALKEGAMIMLVSEQTPKGEKLCFDVNLKVLKRAGLRVNSTMLVSARNVIRRSKN